MKSVGKQVAALCAQALVSQDVVLLHRAQAALDTYVLRSPGGTKPDHDEELRRLRETAPLERLVRNTYRSLGVRL